MSLRTHGPEPCASANSATRPGVEARKVATAPTAPATRHRWALATGRTTGAARHARGTAPPVDARPRAASRSDGDRSQGVGRLRSRRSGVGGADRPRSGPPPGTSGRPRATTDDAGLHGWACSRTSRSGSKVPSRASSRARSGPACSPSSSPRRSSATPRTTSTSPPTAWSSRTSTGSRSATRTTNGCRPSARRCPASSARWWSRTAADRGWSLRGPVKIRVEAAEEVRVGRYQLAGRVEAVGDAPAPSARPRAAGAARRRPAPAPPTTARPSTARWSSARSRAPPLEVRVVAGGERRPPRRRHRVTVRRRPAPVVRPDARRTPPSRASTPPWCAAATRWWVVDLGSTNGTKVNGRRAAEHQVDAGRPASSSATSSSNWSGADVLPGALLTLLKFALLLGLYLFLVPCHPRRRRRPVRAASAQRPAAAPPSRRRRRQLRGKHRKAAAGDRRARPVGDARRSARSGKQPITLGRASGADIVIDDVYASDEHAQLMPDGDGGWTVRDLGSTNGTFLNGAKLTRPTCRWPPVTSSGSARPASRCADDRRDRSPPPG